MNYINIINLIRIKDWSKNILIFIPLIFSGNLFNTNHYNNLIVGFFILSFVASCIYILNDYIDIESDKKHPTKKYTKPFASNQISLNFGIIIFVFLIVVICLLIYEQNSLYLSIIFYLSLSLSYIFIVKKLPFIELIFLSLGYVIRIDAGSKLINVESSILMLISTFFLGTFFIILKRLSELNHYTNNKSYETRRVLKYYNKKILKILSLLSIILVMLTLVTYVIIKNVLLILSIILFLIFLLYYFYKVRNITLGENPINAILENKILFSLSILILISSVVIYL